MKSVWKPKERKEFSLSAVIILLKVLCTSVLELRRAEINGHINAAVLTSVVLGQLIRLFGW